MGICALFIKRRSTKWNEAMNVMDGSIRNLDWKTVDSDEQHNLCHQELAGKFNLNNM